MIQQESKDRTDGDSTINIRIGNIENSIILLPTELKLVSNISFAITYASVNGANPLLKTQYKVGKLFFLKIERINISPTQNTTTLQSLNVLTLPYRPTVDFYSFVPFLYNGVYTEMTITLEASGAFIISKLQGGFLPLVIFL